MLLSRELILGAGFGHAFGLDRRFSIRASQGLVFDVRQVLEEIAALI